MRPYQADFKNPNYGRPDFKFSYRFPEHLRKPSAMLDQLPFLREPPTPEALVQDCATAGARAQAALRRIFRLQRRRRARVK